jgi:MYXO-CTERM domain-containing protein
MECPVSSRVTGWIAAAQALGMLAAPRIVHACSVCSAGTDDESRTAFILTTAFLTFLPLILVGGLVWWLRRRTQQLPGHVTSPRLQGSPEPRTAKA